MPFDTVMPSLVSPAGAAPGAALGSSLRCMYQPAGDGAAHPDLAPVITGRRYSADHDSALPYPGDVLQRLTGRGFGGFRPVISSAFCPRCGPPRFSLASGRRTDLSIVVRKHPGSLYSGQLLALEPGEAIHAFVRLIQLSAAAGRAR